MSSSWLLPLQGTQLLGGSWQIQQLANLRGCGQWCCRLGRRSSAHICHLWHQWWVGIRWGTRVYIPQNHHILGQLGSEPPPVISRIPTQQLSGRGGCENCQATHNRQHGHRRVFEHRPIPEGHAPISQHSRPWHTPLASHVRLRSPHQGFHPRSPREIPAPRHMARFPPATWGCLAQPPYANLRAPDWTHTHTAPLSGWRLRTHPEPDRPPPHQVGQDGDCGGGAPVWPVCRSCWWLWTNHPSEQEVLAKVCACYTTRPPLLWHQAQGQCPSHLWDTPLLASPLLLPHPPRPLVPHLDPVMATPHPWPPYLLHLHHQTLRCQSSSHAHLPPMRPPLAMRNPPAKPVLPSASPGPYEPSCRTMPPAWRNKPPLSRPFPLPRQYHHALPHGALPHRLRLSATVHHDRTTKDSPQAITQYPLFLLIIHHL